MRNEVLLSALSLAEDWANSAGRTLAWGDSLAMLTEPDATRRALWRCALELARLVQKEAGDLYPELQRDLGLEPVSQYPEGPGG